MTGAKLQEQFEAVNQLLHTILKNISEGLLFVDFEGRVTLFNEAGQKLLQREAESLLLRPFWDSFPDEYFGFSMREALTFGISHRLLYKRIISKEFEISTSFFYDGTRPYHGLLLLLRDITEKQRLQLLASRNDRLKELGETAATVAHEIRNPLGGIRGFASLLYRDLEREPHLQEMASAILEGIKRLEQLVTSVLHYARPIEICPQSTEIGALLRQFGKFIKADPAFPSTVKLELHIPDAPLLAPVDAAALKSALLNLLFNAVQAMPYGGIISISLFKLDHCCQIAISDTGVGMDEEILKRLFSPFFTTKQKGNGLGLVEAQKIASAHFGALDVRSAPGKGTTFTLTLPLKR